MTEAIAIREAQDTALDRLHPREIVAQATEEANVLAGVIEKQKLFSMIQGKRFVKVEGWVTLATLRGCLPREVEVQELPEGRYVAIVELVRMSDGAVLTRASAECGGAGDTIWMSRPSNARRSMAITRATGKAARVAFSWVMALAGFEVTPAEEMDHVGSHSQEERDPTSRGQQAATSRPPARGVSPAPEGVPVWRGKLVNMETKDGKTNGKPWTLFTFTGSDGQKFGTFSETVAKGLTAHDGKFVEIVYSQTAKGNLKIEEYRDVNAEEAPFA